MHVVGKFIIKSITSFHSQRSLQMQFQYKQHRFESIHQQRKPLFVRSFQTPLNSMFRPFSVNLLQFHSVKILSFRRSYQTITNNQHNGHNRPAKM